MTWADSDEALGKPFPWHLQLYDAHCHPTDEADSLNDIGGMKTKGLTIMSTRDEDQSLVAQFAGRFPASERESNRANFVIPSFGYHPWFSHQIFDDGDVSSSNLSDKEAHYASVLEPSCEGDKEILNSLPIPRPLSSVIAEIRANLEIFPLALVGEIGLDRSFRVCRSRKKVIGDEEQPHKTSAQQNTKGLSRYRVCMQHQRQILKEQLMLAADMKRAVSVHGVAAHGILYQVLAETWENCDPHQVSNRKKRQCRTPNSESSNLSQGNPKGDDELKAQAKPYPPRICLHSYSGSADTMKRYLNPSVPPTVFFSFSCLVNNPSIDGSKSIKTIRDVPGDRILVESDLHSAGDHMDELMETIVRDICRIRKWTLEEALKQLASNWRNFVFGNT